MIACQSHQQKRSSEPPPRFSANAGRQFESASCAPPSLSAAVAHLALGRSARIPCYTRPRSGRTPPEPGRQGVEFAMTTRDEFSKPVVARLASRAGHRCSNPDCRRPTSGPEVTSDGVVNIGVAAHITAAAAGEGILHVRICGGRRGQPGPYAATRADHAGCQDGRAGPPASLWRSATSQHTDYGK